MYTANKDDTVHNLKASARELKDNAVDAANDVGHDIRSAANQAGRKVRTLVNNASSEINHATDTVTTQIRSKPVESSLIALGVGYIIGRLFHRS